MEEIGALMLASTLRISRFSIMIMQTGVLSIAQRRFRGTEEE
jgi:hypothetical protein